MTVQPSPTGSTSSSHGPSIALAAAETLLIFLLFSLQAATPAPDVNEPHYLTKAKHYWSPQWCEGDFFLQSPDAHHVFYWAFGWLTLLAPLPVVAWIGRIVGWALLAIAWRRLSWALVPRKWMSVLSAAVWVVAMNRCHMAGEWALGGVEAKVFAYACVLLAVEQQVRRRWTAALCWAGAATALHVLVGGWTLVAMAVAWLVNPPARPRGRSLALGIAGAALLAAPGLIPSIHLTVGAEPAVAREASQIYVYERLPHHLLPQKMKPPFIDRFVALIVLWIGLTLASGPDDRRRRFDSFVVGAMAIWLIGMLLAMAMGDEPDRAAPLLRFYWFRLFDVMAPAAVAIAAVAFAERLSETRRRAAVVWLVAVVTVCTTHFAFRGADLLAEPRPPAENAKKVADVDNWREACHWIRDSGMIPQNARFLTPRASHTFKWHTGRPEVVTQKDIPQDAAGIVQWRRRLIDLFATPPDSERPWYRSLARREAADLIRLGQKYDASYLLTRAEPPAPLKRLFANDDYAVYELVPDGSID